MENLSIYIIPAVLLFVALSAIAYKQRRLSVLRRKHNVHIHYGLFTLYPAEYIFSTTSEKKRQFMIASNRATYIILSCLGITILLILFFLLRELVTYLETLN